MTLNPGDLDPAAAGQSAQNEFDRRHQGRRQDARARYGVIGAMASCVTSDPMHIRGWQQGAHAEIVTARELALRLCKTDVIVLHDRRIPGHGRANIDHIAVGPGGLTIIDTKSTRGRVEITTTGLVKHQQRLLVNGRDRSSQLDFLERQIRLVSRRLVQYGMDDVQILGALAYPFMDRPWLYANQARNGLIRIDRPSHIAKLAGRPGQLSRADIHIVAERLAKLFPAAA